MSWKPLFHMLVVVSLIWLTNVVSVRAADLSVQTEAVSVALRASEYATLSEAVEKLIQDGRELGYENFSDNAFLMLRAAASLAEREPVRAGFLVRLASRLAPTDPRVMLEASTLPGLAFSERLEFFQRFASSAVRFPTLSLSMAVEGSIIALTAVTLSLIFFCVVQLGVHCADLIEGAGDLFPRTIWGFAGPIAVIIVLALPIAFGILPMLIVWSVVLGWFVKRCRWLPALVGSLILFWVSSAEIFQTVRTHLVQPEMVLREEIANAVYRPTAVSTIARITDERLADGVSWALLGQAYARMGRWKEALDTFTHVLQIESISDDLAAATQLNVTAVHLAHDKIPEALASLAKAEQLGASASRSFQGGFKSSSTEFDFHLLSAQARIASTDLVGYQSHYDILKELDPVRLAATINVDLPPRKEFPAIPAKLLYQPYVTAAPAVDPQEFATQQQHTAELINALSGRVPAPFLLPLGVLLVFIGGFVWWRAEHATGRMLHQVRGERAELISKVWAILPGGLYVAGRRPFIGIVIVTTVVALTILISGIPMQLPILHQLLSPFSGVLWGVVLLLLLGSTVLSIPAMPTGDRTVGRRES